jgi:hypothetical protein
VPDPDPETGEPINVGHMIPRSIDDLKRHLTSATRNRINNHLRNVDKSRAYALVDGILAAGRKPAP